MTGLTDPPPGRPRKGAGRLEGSIPPATLNAMTSPTPTRLLMIEDDARLAQMVTDYLGQSGFAVTHAPAGEQGLEQLQLIQPELVILDLMMPGMDGLEVCRRIRAMPNENARVPVLMLTAKGDPMDRIIGLELGADDYLPKPFHLAELLARIRAIFRRSKLGGSDILEFNEILINHQSLEVSVHGKPLDLTKKEFDLLVFLLTNKNKVLSKQAIATHLWGDYTDDLDNFDFVYQHIKNLRKKICSSGGRDYLTTVYGLGYKLDTNAL